MEEVWKDVVDFEGFYQVSNFGNVKRMTKTVYKNNNVIQNFPEKIIATHKHRNRYYSVHLTKGVDKFRLSLHRLVAIAFLNNSSNKFEVNHIDCNKSNNKVTNLEWVNRHENQSYKKNGKTRYVGVIKNNSNTYTAYMGLNGKRNHLGTFKTEEEAHLARRKFEVENNIENKYSQSKKINLCANQVIQN